MLVVGAMLWRSRGRGLESRSFCVRLLWCQIVDFALRERTMYLRKIEVSEVKRNRMRMHITSLSYLSLTLFAKRTLSAKFKWWGGHRLGWVIALCLIMLRTMDHLGDATTYCCAECGVVCCGRRQSEDVL